MVEANYKQFKGKLQITISKLQTNERQISDFNDQTTKQQIKNPNVEITNKTQFLKFPNSTKPKSLAEGSIFKCLTLNNSILFGI